MDHDSICLLPTENLTHVLRVPVPVLSLALHIAVGQHLACRTPLQVGGVQGGVS